MWNSSAVMLCRFKVYQGGWPVTICSTVQPTDQMSLFLVSRCCVTTSGAMK